jgi:hypothetical protein
MRFNVGYEEGVCRMISILADSGAELATASRRGGFFKGVWTKAQRGRMHFPLTAKGMVAPPRRFGAPKTPELQRLNQDKARSGR